MVKAPGLPTEEDGFKPKKKWDGKLVKNPNGFGWGFPDEHGNIWVPTGQGTGVHEPHWDVQNPRTGKHTNRYPKGGERKPRK